MSKVLDLMERHYFGQTKVIYEWYCFNNRNQESGESFDAYLTALRTLAKTCNFGLPTDELILDRIVFGILRQGNKKKISSRSQINLQSCVNTARSAETTPTQKKATI